ncbi:DUF421 domain-containing protein [Clostridium sp. UBA7503]|uniref:DUF421 domain-containing protein n=1 Tax=Clostridium sp. UBA7503 TaxID=1946377 RepID=UPI003216E41E
MIHEIYRVALRALISVSILFVLTRIMGKKQISQLTFFDYVVSISIGSIAAAFAVDDSIGYIKGLTGMVVYSIFPILLSFVSLKSYLGRKVLDGIPTILIENGKIVENGLKKAEMNINDLLEECRLKNVFDISAIEFAIMETSGKLSIQLKSSNQPLTPKDMNMLTLCKGLCINLIVDGEILEGHLKTIGKDINWLNTELQSQGIKSSADVLLAYQDNSNVLITYLKNSDPPVTPIL